MRNTIELKPETRDAVGDASTPMVSAIWYHTCALKNDGQLVCWGDNSEGQSTVPADLVGVAQVAGGELHTCALKRDGTVVCWGNNSYGQSTVPVGLSGVTQIMGGGYHNCALKSDATVVCWGYNFSGPTTVPADLGPVIQLSDGAYHTCVLKSDRTVRCWGSNVSGQQNVPPGLTDVVQLSGDTYTICALKSDGSIVCWGNNGSGQATPPAGLSGVVQLAPGHDHTCALKTDGTVQCWGSNSWGQANVPAGLSGVTQINSGIRHTCVVKSDGTVVCWGNGPQIDVPTGLTLNVVQPQAIAFTSTPPSPSSVGQTYTVSATGGGSGSAVVFSSLTAPICSVTGNIVSLLSVGTCTVAANQAAGPGYLAAPQVTQSFSVVATQAIVFTSAAPDPGVVGTTYSLTAQGGPSDNQVTFSSLSATICTVTGSTASLIDDGTCIVAADQAAGNGYLAAPQATQSFTVVAPQAQAINFTSTPPDPAVVGRSYTVSALGGGSGNPVLFSSLTPSVCFVVGNTVSFVTRGTCHVAADQTGSTLYLPAAQSTQTFDIYDLQTITFTSVVPNPGIVGSTYSLAATGGLSGNSVTFSSLSAGVCTVSGSSASLTGAGTCVIAADQAAGSGYLAAPRKTQSFTVAAPIPQTITFSSTPPSPALVGGSYSVTASGGASGNPVLFSSLTPSVCFVIGNTVSLNARGTCGVAADQTGNTPYLPAAQATQTFDIYDVQAITFTSASPDRGVVGGTYSVAATGGLSGNPVTFSSLSASVCSVSGHTASLTGVGTCVIAAAQAAGGGYLAAPQATQSFDVVAPIPQVISFTSAPSSPALVGSSYTVAASGGASGNAIRFSSLTPGVCSVSGSTVSLGARGNCQIAADQAGNTFYLQADQKTQSFNIYDVQAITFTSLPPDQGVVGETYSVRATGGPSGSPVTFSSQSTTVCTVSGSTVALTGAGTCIIAADQAAGSGYLAAPQVRQSFSVVAPQSQTINFTSSPPSPALVGGSYTVAALGGASGNQVLFSSLTPSVCSVVDNSVRLNARGNCTVAADQGGTRFYLRAAQVTQAFNIYDVQAITFTSTPPATGFVGETYSVSATGGLSGNPVTFRSLSETICTVSGGTATLIRAGTCVVAADQAAGNNYLAAAQVSQNFGVADPQLQAINFTSSPLDPGVVGGTYSLSATGGLSGNPVTFSSLSTGVCTMSGSTATLIHAGTCTVAADQAASRGYLAAAQATQHFTVVDPIPQVISFTSAPSDPALVGGSYLVSASGGASGIPVLFSSLTPSVCFVLGNTVSLNARGTCQVAADQGGNTYYVRAAQVEQTFDIYDVQAIAFTSTPPDPGIRGETYSLSANGGLSGNPVTFSSLSASVCTVTGSTANLTGAGTCVIAADQAAGSGYLAAPRQTQSFTVIERQPQGISFTSSPPSPAVVGGAYTVTASGGGSGNPVLFSSLTPSVCFVLGNTVSLVTRGTCHVAADQAGSTYYFPAAQVEQIFDISDVQAITFTSVPPAPAIQGATYSLAALGGLSGNPVTFSSLSTDVCTVSGSTATMSGVGTCVVAGDQAAGGGYLAAPQTTQSFDVVAPTAQVITFTSTPPNPPIIGGTYAVSANGGGSGNVVTFTTLTPGTCGISGVTASFTARGTCTIAANQAGGGIYLSASQVTQTFVIDTRPVANAGSGQTGYEGTAVTFNAGGSSDADGDAINTYTWDFGDGMVQSVSSPTVQHVYNDNSSSAYVVRLTVTDARGATSLPATTSATIGNIAPIGSFAPASPTPEGIMNLSLTGVQDALGDLPSLQYAFDCGDGSSYRPYGSSAAFACNAADNGTRTVGVRVKDKDGAISEYSRSISVTNVAPTITITSAPTTGKVNVDYTIQFRFSDPGTIDSPWSYQINWGDGQKTALTATTTQGNLITQTHQYTLSTIYTITVTVRDKDSGTGTATVQLTIPRPRPVPGG